MQVATQYNPLVSVIIPVKNNEQTLETCLRSIKRSYYKNIEVVVVNDHSTDNTVDVAHRYECTVLTPEMGGGANNARNFGAQHAKGDILIFIDSDIVIALETMF